MGKKKTKRVVVVADFHCGHRSGLTPPNWQLSPDNEWRKKWAKMQGQLWDYYHSTLKKLQPIDCLIANGDLIDGRGERSGGEELIATRTEQVQMAIECVNVARAKHKVLTRGTPYHTGRDYDWEDDIATSTNAKIGEHEWVGINGVTFDCRHKVGGSTIPYGRHTAVARERLWAILWAERGQAPKSDVIIRSHVHYFDYCGEADWLALTTPALQGVGSKYGSRQVSGVVDFGLLHFDVKPSGDYSWAWHIARLSTQRARVYKL